MKIQLGSSLTGRHELTIIDAIDITCSNRYSKVLFRLKTQDGHVVSKTIKAQKNGVYTSEILRFCRKALQSETAEEVDTDTLIGKKVLADIDSSSGVPRITKIYALGTQIPAKKGKIIIP